MLAGSSHALAAASSDALSLGLAPLHAYTMGFLGSALTRFVEVVRRLSAAR